MMTHKEIAGRLRALADREPTYVWRELYALARAIEDGGPLPAPPVAATTPPAETPDPKPEPDDDLEALVRATQRQPRRGVLRTLLYGRRR